MTTAETKKIRNAKWRDENPKKKAAANKAWRDAHPEYNVHARARRRVLTADHHVELVTLQDLFDRDGNRCAGCRRRLVITTKHCTTSKATLDHVIPLSKGGKHELSNCQAMCLACNSRKGLVVETLF